jgi:hypothetical protein
MGRTTRQRSIAAFNSHVGDNIEWVAANQTDVGGLYRNIGTGAYGDAHIGQRFRMFVHKISAIDLVVMRELIEAGKVMPVAARTWAFSEARAALHHVGAGHSRGLNVVCVSD